MFSLFNFPHNLKGLIEDERLDQLQQISFLEWSLYLQREKGLSSNELAQHLTFSPIEWKSKLSQQAFPSVNKIKILLRLLNE